MIVNPVTGKHHTLNSKKGRETLKSYLKTYKDDLERKERVEEGTHKMWEKKSVQKPSLNLENIQPTHLLTDYLDTDSLSKLTTVSSSLKDVGERTLDDRYKYYKHGDGNILRNCLICDKPLRDTPRKAIIKLSCGCVFHYDCVLEYIRKVEDRIDIAKTNTKQWDITNEVIPSTELDPVTLRPIVATRRDYSTRHKLQKYNPISMIQNYFYGPRGNPELVGRRATNVPDDYFWRTSPSQPMPMEEALDEFVRHRNREPRYGRKRAMERDIRKARRCPAFDCFKNFDEYDSLKKAMIERLSYLEYWRQKSKIALLTNERRVLGGLLGFRRPIYIPKNDFSPLVPGTRPQYTYIIDLKELVEKLIIITFGVAIYLWFNAFYNLRTSGDSIAHYNDAYMRMPRQATHGWSLRLPVDRDDKTNINEVFFGETASRLFGDYDMSSINPDELTAITNIYAEEIGTQLVDGVGTRSGYSFSASIQYGFDWWSNFNDAIVKKDIDSMEELLWEHQNMGLLPPVFSMWKNDVTDYIKFFRRMDKENRPLLEKLSKTAKDGAFINILNSIKSNLESMETPEESRPEIEVLSGGWKGYWK